jgi:drug/metabolite transporter superfamily protein YnfA
VESRGPAVSTSPFAIAWLWFVDGAQLTAGDLIGAGVAVAGMTIIMLPPRPS